MKWTRGTQNDDVVDVRGSSGGGGGGGVKAGAGGVVVLLIVYAVSRALGVDLTGLVSSESTSSSTSSSTASGPSSAPAQPNPPSGPDPDAELVDFIKDVMKDIQDTWTTKFAELGGSYRRAKLYLFSGSISTRCGHASKAIGPFYCPGDENAYIDLSFYRDLRARFGAPGDFAQVYVLAHEIGHHVQKLRGAEREVARAHPEETDNQRSVRIELQADCYAGVWGNAARGRDRLEPGDVDEALTAASAIGDDRLQRDAGGEVNPESFTHGTSEQRVRWFRRGFTTGRIDACDTLTTRDL